MVHKLSIGLAMLLALVMGSVQAESQTRGGAKTITVYKAPT